MTNLQDMGWRRARFPFWLFVGFLIVVFFTGGSARADVVSLAVLRPVAVLTFAVSIWLVKWDNIRDSRATSILAVLAVILMWLYALPFSHSNYFIAPQHELLVEIGRQAVTSEGFPPLTISSWSTLNSNYALFVPLALLVTGIQLNPSERLLLLPVVLGLGLLTGFWGLLQAIGNPQGSLYLYRITNHGAAVGMFANRNHQAILLACLFPMLAVFASMGIRSDRQSAVVKWLAFGAGIVLVPLILVTGSRAGLVFGAAGLMCATFLYRKSTRKTPGIFTQMNFKHGYVLVPVCVLALVAITILAARAQAFERLIAGDKGGSRSDIWQPTFGMITSNFPLGVGPGSFAQAFQTVEPERTLSFLHVNQAHNDWLDILVTLGLPGALLLFAFLIVIGRRAYFAILPKVGMSPETALARLGTCLISLLFLSSVWDYPLRTPIGASLFVAALIWQSGNREARGKNTGET